MDKTAPVFDQIQYPLPTIEELERAGWPRRRDTLARAVLAVSLKGGARDFADGERVTRRHLARREYHHLFPDHLLTGDGEMSSTDSFRALNCALITWNTNRRVAAKEPLEYLEERTMRAALGRGRGAGQVTISPSALRATVSWQVQRYARCDSTRIADRSGLQGIYATESPNDERCN